MRLKFFAAVTILVTASVAAFAQNDEPGNQAPKPTVADLQRLVQTISGDKAKLKVYCEISKLQEEMERAEEKNDTKALEAIGTKVDSHEQQMGPDYIGVIEGLGEVDPNSMKGQKFTAILDPLHKQCK